MNEYFRYLKNGTKMHFVVAIDFTGSNGVHIDPNSLHYLCDEQLNSYEIALSGVGKYQKITLSSRHLFGKISFLVCLLGKILEYYDSSKKLLAFGKEVSIFSNALKVFFFLIQ